MTIQSNHGAPGAPGIEPRWTSSAKTAVGTALNTASRVWFTLSHGIVNEVYYPHVDQACTRDMGLIVTDGQEFFSEEKRNTDSEFHRLVEGVPAFRLSNTCRQGRYRIDKEIVTDPQCDTLLQRIRFTALHGPLSGYHLYVILAPHLGNHGMGNTAWIDEYENVPMLFAQREGIALALACSVPWKKRSVGYVGVSDGWQDLNRHKQMMWDYRLAENGNVAMTAEIDLMTSNGDCVLAVGFGGSMIEAAQNAVGSLNRGFEDVKREYTDGWLQWLQTHIRSDRSDVISDARIKNGIAVMKTHESKASPGGVIASLSIPWGFSKGDDDIGGYHLVWSRDLVEAAEAFLAAGGHEEAGRVLSFLEVTQQPDGHWAQNMWTDGTPYWNGIQMDETALPILLAELAWREKRMTESDVARFWPMIRAAAGYLVRNGPVSPQDRWEEDPGYSPFTVAAEIAALIAAAGFADFSRETDIGEYLRETADVWYSSIDRWMYATHTDWSRRFGVEGYYIRIAPKDNAAEAQRFQQTVPIRNVAGADESIAAGHLVSPDALALVRFGLRTADDPRMRNTIKVIDALLKVETPSGPAWHRYNGDGYGEHKDGSPFDGTGEGRAWPLFTGERAHYELAAGHMDSARTLAAVMESFANDGGLLSEQIWDAPDIPERELYFGRPSGSAIPLVWAHAEYLKLRRSLHDGRVFDMPMQTAERYLKGTPVTPRMIWRFNHKIRSMPSGKHLRIETMAHAIVHWSADGWHTIRETETHDPGLGTHVADLETAKLPAGTEIRFTFHWQEAARWEGKDFIIHVDS